MLLRGKKIVGILVITCFLVVLAACSGGKSNQPEASSETSETAPTVNVVMTWDPGIDISSDSLVFQEWGKRTNVNFDVTFNPRDNHKDKVNLLLASNKLPDLLKFFQDTETFNQYGPQLFAPLDDYLNSGKLPNLKKYLEKYPEIEKRMRNPVDGKLYAFPFIKDYDLVQNMWYVRNDLLKKEGLDASKIKTLDDFKQAALALKKASGQNYITSSRLGFDYFTQMTSAYFGFAGMGDSSGVFYDASVKKFVFAPIALKDQYKQWVEFEKWMVDNKLLDPNFLTMKDQQLFAGYSDGSYPLQREQMGLGYLGVTNMNPTNDPGIDIQPIYPFEVNGRKPTLPVYTHYDIAYRSPWVINKNSKHIPELMKAMDYTYSDEGVELFIVGVEGVTFTRDSNSPSGYVLDKVQSVWTKGKDGSYPAGMKTLQEYGFASVWISGVEPMYNRFGLLNYKEDEKEKAFIVRDQMEYLKKNGQIRGANPDLVFTADERAKQAEIRNALKTYTSENVAKFILGSTPLSEYDRFLKGYEQFKVQKLLDDLNNKLQE